MAVPSNLAAKLLVLFVDGLSLPLSSDPLCLHPSPFIPAPLARFVLFWVFCSPYLCVGMIPFLYVSMQARALSMILSYSNEGMQQAVPYLCDGKQATELL